MEKRRYQYRRTIMFACRMSLMGSMAGIFVLIWSLFYQQARFFRKGNYIVIGIYCVIYFLFNTMYGGFRTGVARHGEVLYSNAIALIFTDLLLYFQLSLFARALLPPEPMLLMWALQFAASAILTYFSNSIYFKIYPVRDVLFICRNVDNEERFMQKIKSIKERYHLKRIMTQDKEVSAIKEGILQVNCVMISDVDLSLRNELVEFCYEHSIRVYIMPNVEDIMLNTAQSTHIFDTPVLLCKNYQLTNEQRIWKRAVDILLSSLGLLAASPIMLLEALAIKLYDGGPVFYRQERLTYNNQVFRLYKFRSMVVNAEADGVARLASKGDNRITPLGRFLRSTRLDELPQLINILRGEMSVVGPRPERPELVEKNIQRYPEFKYRTKVKAGLTGYAQVYGKYNTTPEDKLKMDLLYIERYSILLDLKLMFLTFKILFQPDAAEGVDDWEQRPRGRTD
ncbi:MAG: exopolysaccharide biosynthesis polyprenyl glycosylphosphotransferase [Provencibacterium sp.]|nr:exopolysaccharide biosynthesis polyprenyl glycosylphosphotransferase [Provencibacterium sp.]